ncbi:MAG: S8 family serine peptidase, partial [Acutalibacteraceae bacterium]
MEAKKRSMQILKAVIIFIMCLTVAVPTMSVVPGMSVTASAAASIKTPALKKVTALNYYSLQVEWSAVKGVTGYAVYRKSGSSGYKRIATLTGSTKCKYVDEKAATGTEYTYTVRAYIKKGSNVTWSSYVKNGIKGKTSLSKPAIKSIADGKSKQLTVNWGKVAGATGYMLYRSTSQNGKYTLLKTITKNATVSYTDTKLTNGKTYYYKIKAYRTVNNKKVYSAYSSVKSKKVTVNVRNADTADEFYKAAAKVNKDNPVKASGAMSGDEFFAKRLIIKGKNSKLNFDKYKPTSVVKSPDNYYIVQFASSSAAKKAFQAISNWSSVDFVEPDSYIGVDAADSSEAVQATVSESKSWGVSAMGADKYASYVSKTANNEIKVAVVDTGVSNHTFLNGRIASGGYDFVDNDSNPADLHGHGTHVSGTIVDCTPGLKVKVLPVRVLDADGSGSSLNVGNAIKYAADHGAKVINLSLGGGHSNYEDDCISYAIKKGVTVVVAAGNENQNTANVCPAHIKNAIVVAAVDSKLKKAYFSNYGSSVDVAAPGVDILSCLPGGRYARWNGTSMATPHIAAVAAMYKLVYPSKTPAEIEKLVKTNVKDLGASGWDKYFGNGFPKLKVPSSGTISPTGITL